MDFESARFWADIGQWVFNGLVAVYLWITRRHKATLGQIKAACIRIDELDREVILLKTLPSKKEFNQLTKDMSSLSSELSEFKGRLEGINRAVDLMNEYLINRDR